MPKTAQGFQKSMRQGDRKKASSRLPAAPVLVFIPVRNTLSMSQIESAAREWEYDSQYRQLSPLTITENNRAIQKMLWFENGRVIIGH